MIKKGIQKLIEGKDLTFTETKEITQNIMSGKATDVQISAFLTALRIKGEKIHEITAFALVMKEFCSKIHPKVTGPLLDACGTGGDIIKTFNISTASSFVIAGAGISVAKHGNRAVTSKSGSADVLEKFGLNLTLKPKEIEKIIEKIGIGFMFAPLFHPAMKYVAAPRRELGIRTIFNILGPLTNPADANVQLLGVYSKKWLKPIASTLNKLNCKEAMVVHGIDGLDEISIIGKTLVAWLKNNNISMMEINPKDFGFKLAKPRDIFSESPEENVILIFKILSDLLSPDDPRRNVVILNAAAGIFVSGITNNLEGGIELATNSIQSGSAYKKLKMLIKESKGNLTKFEELENKYA